MSAIRPTRQRSARTWQSFEAWLGSRSSAVTLFVVALAVFAIQSVALPVGPGRDMGRYVQAFLQLGYHEPILTSVADTRGPLASLGVGVPLELGGTAAEIWLSLLFAASILGWSAVAMHLGPRAAALTAALLLVNPGYGILFHGLASDALFAAAFAGWAVLLSRAIVRPSLGTFLVAGLGMGALVLVRPANQMLIVMTLLPFVLRAPWARRIQWAAAFFVASAAVTQGWKAVMTLRYGDATSLRPSGAFLVVAVALVPLLVPPPWRRRLLLVSIPVVVVAVAVRGVHPLQDARSVMQSPPTSVFLFRTYEVDPIVSPDNGPETRKLADIIERELLPEEPYRSYGVGLDEVFSSGSDRIFSDVTRVSGGVDMSAVTEEAIRRHPREFATGVARTAWALLRARVFASQASPVDDGRSRQDADGSGAKDVPFVVVNGRKLPAPSEGQPIPASHFGPVLHTIYGGGREVWRSPTEHPFVFDDPRDERRNARFEEQTKRLVARIPTREPNESLVHRMNQLSRAFPPPVLWLAVGIIAMAVRRPRRSLVAIAPAAAGLVVIVGTSLVAFGVSEYALPVSPAFVLLAAAGLLGAYPRSDPSPTS